MRRMRLLQILIPLWFNIAVWVFYCAKLGTFFLWRRQEMEESNILLSRDGWRGGLTIEHNIDRQCLSTSHWYSIEYLNREGYPRHLGSIVCKDITISIYFYCQNHCSSTLALIYIVHHSLSFIHNTIIRRILCPKQQHPRININTPLARCPLV